MENGTASRHDESERALESMGDRHDEIREQLSVMEDWIEALPLTNIEEQRIAMLRVVDFLQRYVLVDARQEERELFPFAGARAEVLRAEHGYIARWVHELEDLARREPTAEAAVRFRATAFKLLGLLDAHMHCEEVVLAGVPLAAPAPSSSVEIG